MSAPIPRIAASFALLLILFGAGVLRLASQGISEDEIRWGSRPYVPPSANAIRVQTNVVQVPVVVRDSNGKAVAGLKKSDFQLFDDGHPVQIASFSVENSTPQPVPYVQPPRVVDASSSPVAPPVNPPPPAPRYVALFFDDTSMRAPDMVMARKAAETFVSTTLKPGDRIGIFTTSTTVTLNFTGDVPKLLETLGQLLSHRKPPTGAGGGQTCQMNPYQASLILQFYDEHSDALDIAGFEHCGDVHDRISFAQNILGQAEQTAQESLGIISDVIRYLARMPGQRMLVLASSGFLTQTLAEKQDKVINEALDANVVINSLDAKGLVAEIPGYDEDMQPIKLPPYDGRLWAVFDQLKTANRERMNDPLAVIAEGTGGKFYHNRNDLDAGLKELAAAPDVSYMLTFSPAALKRNGSAHTLKVKLANLHGMSISARRGYVAPGPNLTAPEKKKGQLDSAVIATDIQSALTAQLTTAVVRSATGEPTLKVAINVGANKLPYQTQGDRKVERLIFITALFDEHDRFLTGVQGVMDLRLKTETMAGISAQGLDAKLSLQAPPGNYRLRQVVQEVGDGRITTINRNIQIQ
jgi:VWFA-related protein